MTTLREAATQALEALEWFNTYSTEEHGPSLRGAEYTLRAALADGDKLSPTEPVAWMDIADDGTRLAVRMYSDGSSEEVPLYLGCDHCRHPLYAAIKCRQCGRVTE